MKLPPPDVARSALGMLKTFGEQAEGEARLNAEKHAANSDDEGRDTWLAIASAIRIASRPTSFRTSPRTPQELAVDAQTEPPGDGLAQSGRTAR